ncbi:MAG: FG-GAP-like repeat-containing protein [Rudaea sp.]|uniref:RHS repeat-associated core domain-containing protein n=1 Tax=Rudaea sp. TaxID=2136325 RepID=UPI0039E52838
MIADVVGYFTSTVTLAPLVPARLMDTRSGHSTIDGQFAGQGAFGTGVTRNLTVWGRGGVPASGVGAVALNLTVVTPSAAGYLTAWGTGTTSGNAPPGASNLNFPAGSVLSVLVIAQVGTNGQVSIRNGSVGNTDVIADVAGWFPGADYGPPSPPTSVTVAASGNTLIASWTLNTGGPPATYLKIQRATSSSGPWTLVNGNYTPATSGQASELVYAAGTYYYEVAACNAAGCSAYKVSTTGAAVSAIPGTPTSDTPVVAATPATDAVSDAVGATAAQFRVDEGGNATYSIPIQVPPGTAGVVPKLALSYNSRLPDGVMGPGWTIEGSSQISRCRQTRESGDFAATSTPDGNPPPVNFTTTDRFCLDGVRLLLLSGNSGAYGADGTTYSPETDPTTQVTAHVSASYVGPNSFTVQRKDGTTSTYGYLASSPNALATASLNSQTVAVNWNLARVQDSKGNYIDYLYNTRPASTGTPSYTFASTAVETTLAQVNYTGHATSPVSTPYASISFAYTTLPQAQLRLGYQSAVVFAQTQQLTSVTVSDSANGTLRYYGLTYSTANSPSGSPFRSLQKVQECRNSSQTVCFPATTFTWSQTTSTLGNNTAQSGPFGSSPIVGFKIADVDGDGRQDIVWAVNSSACSSGSSLYVGFADVSGTQLTFVTYNQQPLCAPLNLQDNGESWNLIDYNGDGRADLMVGGATPTSGNGNPWSIYPSLGRPAAGGKVFDNANNLLAGLATPITGPNCYLDVCNPAAGVLADLNGDGLPDFIYPDPTGSVDALARILVRQSNGTLVFSAPYTVNLGSSFDSACYGSDDCRYALFTNTGANSKAALTTDLNGDGRADLTVVVTGVYRNSLVAPVEPTGKRQLHYDSGLYKGNLSADLAAAGTTRKTYWYQLTMSQLTPTSGVTANGGTLAFTEYWNGASTNVGGTLPILTQNVYLVDLNGDGLADIMYQSSTAPTSFYVLINKGTGTPATAYQAAVSVTLANSVTIPALTQTLVQFADVNNDGKNAIVYPVGSATSSSTSFTGFKYVELVPNSDGTWGFSTPASWTASGFSTLNGTTYQPLVGDMDGDGIPDLVAMDANATSGNRLYASRTNTRYQARDVITGFTNGLGAATQVAYQPLTNIGVYQRRPDTYPILRTGTDFGWLSPVFDVLAPMYVVSQASSSAPTQANAAAQSTVYYRYSGAMMQAGGRGFLGFYETWAFDGNDLAATGNQYVVTLNRYAQHYPFIGMPIATLKEVHGGTAITRGSALMDACAANPEASGYNCFSGIVGSSAAPTFQTPWPDIVSTTSSLAGIQIGFSGQQPACAGAGCAAYGADQCTLGGGAQARTSGLDSNLFTPPANAGPLFVLAYHTTDTQYDLGSGTRSSPVQVATTDNYFCYDTGTYAAPSRGNLQASRTVNSDSSGTTVAEKVTTNTYADNVSSWYLGRLASSQVQFARPGQTTRTRTTNFAYEAASGLLVSERIQSGASVNQDLRTLYDRDAYGNRTAAYQCSSNVTDTQCRAGATNGSVAQRQSGTTVLRYARTSYDSLGRYVTASRLPFATAAGGWNEQQATQVTARDEFGNATGQSAINGTTQTARFGVLGRPYFSKDNIGHASTTTFRLCGSGANCGTDPRFKFRAQTITAGSASSWTYFDVLGRPVMTVAQAFDSNPTTQQFTATCAFTDAHNRPTYQSEPFFLNATVSGDGSPTISGAACGGASYATTTAYDVLGRALTVTTPDGTTTNHYVGLSTFVTNARGYSWETIVNPMGEAVQTLDPGTVNGDTATNLTVTQSYDAMGDVLAITRNAGNGTVTSSFTWDDLGRKLTQTDADSGTTTFTYNAAGDVLTQTDAKGQTIARSYDALGRKWQRVATGTGADWSGTITDAWSYDTQSHGYGQLATETHVGTGDQNLTRTFTYDGYGRLYQRQHVLSGSGTYTETTALDGYGRPKQQQDATGQITTTHYTTKGFADRQNDTRLTTAAQSQTIDAGLGGRLYELLQTNERGQPVSEKRGGSTHLQTSLSYYAKDGRLKGVYTNGSGTTALQDDQYAYDAVGNVTARLKNASSGKSPVEQLTYDGLNRLKQAQLGAWSGAIDSGSVINVIGTQAMTYDALGNLCTQVMTGTGVDNTTQTYTYPGPAGCANHGTSGSAARVTQITGTVNQTYQYDSNGNQTTRSDGRTLTYNALNQAVKAQLGGDTTTFQYGPEGERYLRSDNGILTLYIGKVEITIANGTTSEQKRYLGVAIDLVMANDTRYVLTDHLGSTNVIAHADGTKVEQQAFDAWGNRRSPDTWTQTGIDWPITTTTHGFTGQEGVEAMGIVHFNGRIYDPQLGKMLQADPVQNPGSQGLNRYAYVANNPLSLTDPSGYSWFSDILKTVVSAAIIYFAPYLAPYLSAFGAYAGYAAYAIAGFAAGVVQTGTLQGGLIGAFSAAVGYGIVQKFGTGLSWQGVLARSTEGGVVSSLEGGKFGNGFFSAGVSAAFAPSISQLHNSGTQYLATALVGGTASVVSGGKFANGAESAVFQKAVSDGLDAAMQGYGHMNAQQQKLAYMSTAAYGDRPWQLAGLLSYDIYDANSGFGATVFPGYGDEATVVAFRGTRPMVLKDWENDAQQSMGLDSAQYDHALDLAKNIYSQQGGNVLFTGHSLGGGEAAAAAYYTGGAAVTFNAAGLSTRYQASMWLGPENGPGAVTNFHINGDPLSTFQHFFPVPGAVGTQIAMPPQQLERHSIKNFWY